MVFDLDFGPWGGWQAGTSLYIVWADDNGNTNPDGDYTIDDISFVPTLAALSVLVTSPVEGASYGAGAGVVLEASASAGSGATITGVGFYSVGGGWLGSVFGAPYVSSAVFGAGNYGIYAIVTNDLGGTAYSLNTNQITVTNIVSSVVIVSPTNSQVVLQGASVTVRGVSSVYVTNVVIRVGGVAVATNQPVNGGFTNVLAGGLFGSIGSVVISVTGRDVAGNTPVDSVTISVVANNPPVFGNDPVVYSGGVTGLTFLVGSAVTNVWGPLSDDGGLGVVTNVSIYVPGRVLPYRVFNNPGSTVTAQIIDRPSGVQVFTAVAMDNTGLVATQKVSVTYTNPGYAAIVTNRSEWKYYTTNSAPPTNGILAWYQGGYDDSGWLSGYGEFGNGDTAAYPEETLIDIGGASKYLAVYFRKTFSVGTPGAFTNLMLAVLRDDGVVVWLNGAPVWTNNMATTADLDTAQGYTNIATTAGDDGTIFTWVMLPTNGMVAGVNTLAVEVHQPNTTSTDLSFDLMLWGMGVVEGPPLVVERVGKDVRISWVGSGWTLQVTDDLQPSGTVWTDVPGSPGSPYTVTPGTAAGQKFYRLRQ